MARHRTLDHEAFDVPMEDRPVVLSSSSQCKEVEGRAWTCITEDLTFQITLGCMDRHRHGLNLSGMVDWLIDWCKEE